MEDSTEVSKYFMPFDVIVASHGGKWGVFPALEICGFEDMVYASEDSNPFIYDGWVIARNGDSRTDPETYEAFILLKKENRWNALRVTRGTAICLPEEEGLDSETPEALIEKLEEKYSIRLHMREDSDHTIKGGEAPAEFDVEKNFLVHYDMFLKDPSMCGEHVRLIQMAIGLEQYNCDRTHLYAAAHGDPYATVLLGRELFLELREYSDKRDKDEEVFTKEEKERLDALLDTCLGYLRLGKKYADEKGNKTMGDIAVALFDCADAIPRFVVKSGGVPSLGRFPFPFPKKK